MLVIGHRGWPQEFPENTLVGLQAAIDLGVDMVEVDVHLSKDGHIVAMHDENVKRTTDGRGSIRKMTLSRIRKLDAGSWHSHKFKGQRVPTLEEVLSLVSSRAGLAVEVKYPDERTEALDEKLIPMLAGFPGQLLVLSFDPDYLKAFKRKAPHLKTGFLCQARDKMLEVAVQANCDGIHPHWRRLNGDMTTAAHQEGLTITTWTAKDRKDCEAMLRLDVDGIATDCPDVLLNLLSRGNPR